MVRKVHSEGLRERENMRNHSRKDGDWCVVGFCDDWSPSVGLQGWGYESESEARKEANALDRDAEFQHVEKHEVMTKSEFESLCQKRGVSRSFPW